VSTNYTIRRARRADIGRLVAFTLAEGREAEGLELDVEAVTRGVAGAFATPPLAAS
jgi:hypothetical protein